MSALATFGRYQLEECVARGGMAEVFRARFLTAGGIEKTVCIKRILPKLSDNSEFVRLFVQEAKIVLPLAHGNITQVFDFGCEGGLYYLAMEFVEGPDLDAVIDRARAVNGGLSLPSVLYIASEVAKGLAFAHGHHSHGETSRQIAHRDVTPHNILVSYAGQVKLTDFGVSTVLEQFSDKPETTIRGKAAYVAPEVFSGALNDLRSDIYSLGKVIGDMARRFAAPGSEGGDSTPEQQAALEAIVQRATRDDPEERYQLTETLQIDLAKTLHQVAPEFTSADLADELADLFAWELSARARSNEESAPRDRLLFQLERAGRRVDKENSTDQLLQLATVALAGEGSWRRWLGKTHLIRLGAALAIVCVVVLAALLYPKRSPSTADGGDGQRTLRRRRL